MKKGTVHLTTLALATVLALTLPAAAAQGSSDSPYSVGLQSSWPAYGLSAKMDLSDKMALQGVLGALGTLTTVSGRGYWYLDRQEKHAWYGFGTVGAWRWSDRYYVGGDRFDDSETAIAFGGGAGVELDWRAILDSDFPRLYTTLDLGLTVSTFDVYQNWSLIGLGVGLHYHF